MLKSSFTLFAIAELIHRFFFTVLWQLLLKHIFGRISGRGNVVEENVRRGSIRQGTVLRGSFFYLSDANGAVLVSLLSILNMRPATLLKKKLWHRCFPVNFVKFLRTPFLQNTSERMLLQPLSLLLKHIEISIMVRIIPL